MNPVFCSQVFDAALPFIISGAAGTLHETPAQPASIPIIYWLFWAAVLLLILLLAAYTRHAGKAEDKEFAVLITIISVCAIIIIRDPSVTEFIAHPPAAAGYLAALVMVIASVLLVFYAVKGRESHP